MPPEKQEYKTLSEVQYVGDERPTAPSPPGLDLLKEIRDEVCGATIFIWIYKKRELSLLEIAEELSFAYSHQSNLKFEAALKRLRAKIRQERGES